MQYKNTFISLEFLKYFLISSFTYWVINFLLSPNILSPLHQDDYLVLGAGVENLRWAIERPVSSNLAYLMGEMGATFSYALINFLTVAVPAMVLYFLSQLLRVRIGWILVFACSVMTFSHYAAFEHGKYLGLITNLTSHFFGCLALIVLLHVREKPRVRYVALAVVFYGLSVFAKEDFLLPPLLLLVYFGADLYYPRRRIPDEAINHQLIDKRWWLTITLWFVALAAASALFGLSVKNPFLVGILGHAEHAAPYAINFNPAVLLDSLLQLTLEFSARQVFAGMLAFILLGALWKERWRELLLLAAMVLCLILPYALIPNRIIVYRVFAWLPWLSALFVITIALFWREKISLFSSPKTSKIIAAILFFVSFLIGYLDHRAQLMVADWYKSNQEINQRMLNSLMANKAMLNRENVVGVTGVNGLSPWSNNDGSYLQKKLGFTNHWLVFVDHDTMFYTINRADGSTYLPVLSSQELCQHPGLLLMQFDATGLGTPLRASELCATGKTQ